MKTVDTVISPLVKSQFPAFYNEHGPAFILFAEEYFRWLEINETDYSTYANTDISSGNVNYHLRRLTQYRDIDETVDDFLKYFTQKYFKGIDQNTVVSKRRLVKAAQDIFSSKGSDRSFELFFNLVYGVKIDIYRPGEDLLKPSDGTWVQPIYLELSQSSRTLSYVGKQVTGTISNATAFIEYLITRNINGKLVDIAFLSNLKGRFQTGEFILDNEIFENSPKVVGSLSSLELTLPGEGFSVGEIVNLVSSRGVEGKARVSAVEGITGIVSFTIVDGGWGYTNNALTIVSTRVLDVANVINSNTEVVGFTQFETLTQNLYNFSLTNVTGELLTGVEFNNKDSSNVSLSVSTLVQQASGSNTCNIVLNQISSNVFSNNIILEKHRAIISTNTNVLFSTGSALVQSNGSSNTNFGVVSSTSNVVIITSNTSTIGSNGIHVGTYVEQDTTSAYGTVSTTTRESNFAFTNVSHLTVKNAVGNFNNTSNIKIYSDSSKATLIGNFDPLSCVLGYQYLLTSTNLTSNTRWSTSNTVILSGSPLVNTTILVASDVGGLVNTSVNVTATGNVISSNSSSIGLTTVVNTFYGNSNTLIRGLTSNTFANTSKVYSGTGADFDIGVISDFETLRLSVTKLGANNVGPGDLPVTKLYDLLVSGCNSGFGYISSVYVYNSGTGYDNTNIVVFSGGNTGAGSYTSGNASITTDASGNIISVSLSANTGNGIISTPSYQITNSTGGSTGIGTNAELFVLAPMGFPKSPTSDLSDILFNLIEFQNYNVGTISSLKNVNPGQNYTATPFVVVYDPLVASYNRRDYVLGIDNQSGSFIVGETIQQYSNTISLQLTTNNFSGNTANNYDAGEFVYSNDGITNVATGIMSTTTYDVGTNTYSIVLSSNSGTWQNTISVSKLTVSSNTSFGPGNFIQQNTANGILVTSNSTTLIVRNVQGTFQANATAVTSNTGGSTTISAAANTKIYRLIGFTSNGISDIVDTDLATTSLIAKGKLKAGSNSSTLFVRRTSLTLDYTVGQSIVGITSGATANIVSVSSDSNTNISGLNANIQARVVASNGSIASIDILSSGFGYENDETINITSLDNSKVASAKANVGFNGFGEGYYSSTKGFLDSNKYIHDGEFYQNFSYEIQTSIPFDTYFSVLKETLHVAGKKMYGRVVRAPVANLNMSAQTSIDIT